MTKIEPHYLTRVVLGRYDLAQKDIIKEWARLYLDISNLRSTGYEMPEQAGGEVQVGGCFVTIADMIFMMANVVPERIFVDWYAEKQELENDPLAPKSRTIQEYFKQNYK
jgi:hypothetical protein